MKEAEPKNHYIAPLEVVRSFICNLRETIQDPNFNVERDLDILPKKRGEEPDDPYTTGNTLIELEFDANDVCRELLSLEEEEYYETIIDNRGETEPPFNVFVRELGGKPVYIKIKIRERERKSVFCVSFHFARYALKPCPYAR